MKFTFPPESTPLEGYTIKRAIHRGGFGEVYYALSDAGKEVALKLLQQNLEVELRGVSQCLNLKHPNLVTIFDVRTDHDGDHWIVMEYVSGKSLDRVIDDRKGPMPVNEITEWMEGLCAGLEYLHDRGIVHRDLKPANIYREAKIVKIGDIGLAKFISESRRSAQTQSVGTVYYMAPEVAHGRYGREVDIYSMGIILYEMLTGDVPFNGESTAEILMKHLSEQPDLSRIPSNLRPVLAEVLHKDPQQRTATAADLLNNYKRALAGKPLAMAIPDESFYTENRTVPIAGYEAQSAPVDVKIRPASPGDQQKTTDKHQQRADHRLGRYQRKLDKKAVHYARRQQQKVDRLARKQGIESQRGPAHPAANGMASPANHHRAAQPANPSNAKLFWQVAIVFAVCCTMTLIAFEEHEISDSTALVMIGAFGYASYRFFKRFRKTAPVANNVQPTPPQQVHVHSHQEAKSGQNRSNKLTGKLLTPETIRSIPVRHRLTEMTGAMTMASFCTILMTVGLYFASSLFNDPGQLFLFSGVTLAGSWMVLFTSKIWEGTRTAGSTRRLLMLVGGLVVGAFAYSLDSALLVDYSTSDFLRSSGSYPIGKAAVSRLADFSTNEPTMAGYMIFFGLLFSLRHWWRHADSFRKRRVRPGSIILTFGVALVLTLIFPFPQPWGLIWATAISSIVQLSAPWISKDERRQLLASQRRDLLV